MQQCDKYINGVPSQSWLATIVTLEVDDFVMIGFACDYYTATIPTICIENKVNESEILQVSVSYTHLTLPTNREV